MPANPARISQITQPNLIAKSKDVAVKISALAARDQEIASALYDPLAAAAENTRQFDLIKVSRNIFQAVLINKNGTFKVGQTVTIIYPRFGLNAGKDFMIKGLSEQFAQGQTILTLWG